MRPFNDLFYFRSGGGAAAIFLSDPAASRLVKLRSAVGNDFGIRVVGLFHISRDMEEPLEKIGGQVAQLQAVLFETGAEI